MDELVPGNIPRVYTEDTYIWVCIALYGACCDFCCREMQHRQHDDCQGSACCGAPACVRLACVLIGEGCFSRDRPIAASPVARDSSAALDLASMM